MKDRIMASVHQRLVSRREFTDDQERARRLEVRVDELEIRAADAEEAYRRLAERFDGMTEQISFLLDRLSTANAADRGFARRLSRLEEGRSWPDSSDGETPVDFRHDDISAGPGMVADAAGDVV